jgi:hypothetical protein
MLSPVPQVAQPKDGGAKLCLHVGSWTLGAGCLALCSLLTLLPGLQEPLISTPPESCSTTPPYFHLLHDWMVFIKPKCQTGISNLLPIKIRVIGATTSHTGLQETEGKS